MTSLLRFPTLLLAASLALGACSRPKAEPQPQAQEEQASAEKAGVVALPADSQKLVGLQVAEVTNRTLPTILTTTGEIAANGDREAHVTTRVAGRVIRIDKTVGDWVGAGEAIAALESVELGQAQADYLQAQAKCDLSQDIYERQQKLLKDNLTARKEVIAAENQRRLDRIELEKASNQLKLLGFSEDRIQALASTRRLDPTIPLRAPIKGVVIAKHLTLGEMLEPNSSDPAFTLSDTSQLWVNADIYEKDLARVKLGQPATITTAAFPGKTYHGKVSLISTTLDKETRTAKARIVVANPDHKLKPEMFVNVRFDVGSQPVVAVPKSAVQEENKQKLVYVPTGQDTFKETPIQVGQEYPDYFQVVSGLKSGDRVVTKGSFDLKAQARKGSFAGED